jgi:hypothetical protein
LITLGVKPAVGWYYAARNEHVAALACYDPAPAVLRAAGDRPNELVGLANRGRSRHALGRYEEAQAYALLTEAGHPQAADLGRKLTEG